MLQVAAKPYVTLRGKPETASIRLNLTQAFNCLFNAIMFPAIFSLAVKGLGDLTSQGSGLLCMAIVGGAVLPMLQAVQAPA